MRPRLEALEDRVVPSNIGVVADDVSGTSSATVFDPVANKVLGSVHIPAPAGPMGDVVTVNNGTLGFVTDFTSQLFVLNLSNPANPTLASGNNPISIANFGEDIAVSPDQQFLVVSDGSNTEPLAVVSVASQTQIGTFSTGSDANSVDITNTGSVLVTSANANNLRRLTINGSGTLTDTGESMTISNPNQVAAAPGGVSGVVVSRGGSIESFLTSGLKSVDTRSINGEPLCSVFDPAGDRVYVRSTGGNTPGSVTVFGFNPSTGQLSASPLLTISVASASTYYGMDQLALSQDGSELFVPDDNSHSIDVFNASTGTQVATITGSSISQPLGITIVTAQGTPATVTAQNASATFSTHPQTLTFSANVASTQPVNVGTVTFTVEDSQGNTVGSPVQSNVSGGTASANFTLPANEPVGAYTIAVYYTDSTNTFFDSGNTDGTLTINPANVTTTAVTSSTSYSLNPQTVTVNATVADDSITTDTVDEGTVTFSIVGSNGSIGSGQGTVQSDGTASAQIALLSEQAVGNYTLDVGYSDSAGNFIDNGDISAPFSINVTNVAAAAQPVSTAYSLSAQTVTLSANVMDKSNPKDTVGEGTVTFTVMNGTNSLGSVTGNVNSDGTVSAGFTLAAGQAAGSYVIDVKYSDSTGNFIDTGDTSAALTIKTANAITAAAGGGAVFRTGAQNVNLTANVTSAAGIVNEGMVTFTVMQGKNTIGTATTSNTVSNGVANVSYALPAATPAGSYTIDVAYSDANGNFSDGGDTTANLTIAPANVINTAVSATANYSPNQQTVTLNANLADSSFSSDTVDEGTVTFTVLNGLTPIGSIQGAVNKNGTASAGFTLPAGQAVGSYVIDVSYKDSAGNFIDSGDHSATLTLNPANVTVTAAPPSSVVYSLEAQSMTLSAKVTDATSSSDTVNEGSVIFTIHLKGTSAVRSVVAAVVNGAANADFALPPGEAAGNYPINVSYTDSPGNFVDSGDSGTSLTVTPANVTTTANNISTGYNVNTQSLILSASVANTSIPTDTVDEGVVTFTVQDASNPPVSVQDVVTDGAANVAFTLPAGLPSGSYTINASYSDSQGNFSDSNDTSGLLTVSSNLVAVNANSVSADYSPNAQNLKLSANVENISVPGQTVGEGVVAFTILNGNKSVGTAQGTVSGGTANATFTLPAGLSVGSYTIAVSYKDSSGNFSNRSDNSATLTLLPANVAVAADKVSTIYNTDTQTLDLSASVADASIATDPVGEGVVTFTISNGNTPLGTTQGTVSGNAGGGGTANANFTLPAGQAAGNYTIAVSYKDSAGNFTDSGDTSANLTVSPAKVTTIPNLASAVYSSNTQQVKLSAGVSNASVPGDTVNEGDVTFTLQQNGTTIGGATGVVVGGTANASLTLPAGLAPGSYLITVGYSDSQGNFSDGGDTSAPLTITSGTVTSTAITSTAGYSLNAQTVTLSANVANTTVPGEAVNEGTVTFTVLQGGNIIGTATASGTVRNGAASVNYALPAGTDAGSYSIDVSYSDGQGNLSDGGDTSASFIIAPAQAVITAVAASTTFSTLPQTLKLSAAVINPGEPAESAAGLVGEGVVAFAITNGSAVLGSAAGAVNGGIASANLTLPGGLPAGSYTIAVSYSDGQGNFMQGGVNNATLTIAAAGSNAQLTQVTLAPSLSSLTTTETLSAHVSSSSPVTQGSVTFFVSNHTVTANVDGNGNATAVVTLPMLQLLGPQDISVQYNDAANNRTPSADAQTAAWRVFNPIVPSTATFAPNNDSVTADLFGLFITYTNGLLTEIDFGSIHLVFSYNAAGQLAQVTDDGMNLL